MGNKKLNSLTAEELKNRLKITRTVTGLFAGALLILFFVSTYLAFTKKFTPLTIVPVALLPLLILNITSLAKIKSEIIARKNLK
ncbi:redox-active disulfide protein 2 [Flavisolibacter sp. BT320]|nr:redox-active disulfide protein 2 [Flavisolibacter longurius]